MQILSCSLCRSFFLSFSSLSSPSSSSQLQVCLFWSIGLQLSVSVYLCHVVWTEEKESLGINNANLDWTQHDSCLSSIDLPQKQMFFPSLIISTVIYNSFSIFSRAVIWYRQEDSSNTCYPTMTGLNSISYFFFLTLEIMNTFRCRGFFFFSLRIVLDI